MGRIGCSHRVLFPLLDLSNMSRASYVYVIPSTDLCCKTHMFISISQRYCTVYVDLVRLFFFFPFPPSVLYYPIIVRCHLILSKGTMFLYLVIMRLACLAGYPCHEYIVRLLSHF